MPSSKYSRYFNPHLDQQSCPTPPSSPFARSQLQQAKQHLSEEGRYTAPQPSQGQSSIEHLREGWARELRAGRIEHAKEGLGAADLVALDPGGVDEAADGPRVAYIKGVDHDCQGEDYDVRR